MAAAIGLFVVLALQSKVIPTLLLDDPANLANHFLQMQHSLQSQQLLQKGDGPPLEFPRHSGAITYLGVLIWWTGGVISLFAARLIRPAIGAGYLLHAGLLTVVLGADDLYLFHESIDFVDLEWVYAAYLAFILIRYRNWLLKQAWLPLLVAIAFFGLSFIADGWKPPPEKIQICALLEEGAKFLGIVSWTFFHVQTAFRTSQKREANQN